MQIVRWLEVIAFLPVFRERGRMFTQLDKRPIVLIASAGPCIQKLRE
jgi:hypothetical protein